MSEKSLINAVVGQGIIARRFSDYMTQSDYLIFAEDMYDAPNAVGEAEKRREEEALKTALTHHADKFFVYFSICGDTVDDAPNAPLYEHKRRMEKLVQEGSKHFLIVRVPHVLGLADTSSHWMTAWMDNVLQHKTIDVGAYEQINVIDVDDVHEIVDTLLKRKTALNKTIAVASPRPTSVAFLIREMESLAALKAQTSSLGTKQAPALSVSDIAPIIRELHLSFGDDHVRRSLVKYLGHMTSKPKLLSIIVPTYNEEKGIEEFYARTKSVMEKCAPRFDHEIIFVNDGSSDHTLAKLKILAAKDPKAKIVNFSRNFGNQIAIAAGIDYARGDLAVVIDDDLQDPPEIILNFISQWDKGYKVVYGVRPKRLGVNPFFKVIAKLYYRTISSLSDTKIPNDTGDFRLLDRVVIDVLKKMKEENRYYRGMVAWVGFPQTGVLYERDKRFAGVSTFSFKKYRNFALNGLTAFTEKPLFFSSAIGLVITIVSFVLAVALIVTKMTDPSFSIPGWTSLSVIILFFGGIQLLSIGILGIYISKIYREVKDRPLYIIESTKNIGSHNDE